MNTYTYICNVMHSNVIGDFELEFKVAAKDKQHAEAIGTDIVEGMRLEPGMIHIEDATA